MTTPIDSLELTLRQLANDFAHRLVEAAFRSPVSELAEGLVAGSFATRAKRTGPKPPRRSREAAPQRPGRSKSKAPAEPRATRAPRPPTRSVRRRERPADDAPTHDSDVPPNVITDPGLLLGVIGSAALSPPRTPRQEEPEAVDVNPGPSDATDSGPVLRPGESLQRTAAGHVVLRRGGK